MKHPINAIMVAACATQSPTIIRVLTDNVIWAYIVRVVRTFRQCWISDMSRFWGLVWGEEAPHQNNFVMFLKSGAGEGIRTLDPNLGKVVLYH